MHAISLAELASTFAALATMMLERKLAPMHTAVHDFWVYHRSRHDQWSQQLAEHRAALNRSGASYRARKWNEILPVLQEILVTEPLSRTLVCFANLLEERCISDELAPLAQSILTSHVEARHRCLHLIVFGNGLPVETAVKLNRMRRHLEVYSDRLIATFPYNIHTDALRFDAAVVPQTRIKSEDVSSPSERQSGQRRSETQHAATDGSWLTLHMHLLAQQLWRSLQLDLDWRAASGRLNHRISQAVLGMFPVAAFDGLGVPKSIPSRWFRSGISTESDGKLHDPAACNSPLNLFFSHKPHIDRLHQPKRRRW